MPKKFDEVLMAAFDAGYDRGYDDAEAAEGFAIAPWSPTFEQWRAGLGGLEVDE